MNRLIGILISFSLVMVMGCPQFNANFLGGKSDIPAYEPNENCKIVGFKAGSEPEGFNGIKWETKLSTLEGMKLLRKDNSYGGVHFYLKEKDPFKLGNGKLESVQYGFWREKFYTGMVLTEGLEDFNAMKEAVFGKFGQGAKPFRNKEEYLWVGKNATMALRYDEYSKVGTFYIKSDLMTQKMS
jgi:hypothetical protein